MIAKRKRSVAVFMVSLLSTGLLLGSASAASVQMPPPLALWEAKDRYVVTFTESITSANRPTGFYFYQFDRQEFWMFAGAAGISSCDGPGQRYCELKIEASTRDALRSYKSAKVPVAVRAYNAGGLSELSNALRATKNLRSGPAFRASTDDIENAFLNFYNVSKLGDSLLAGEGSLTLASCKILKRYMTVNAKNKIAIIGEISNIRVKKDLRSWLLGKKPTLKGLSLAQELTLDKLGVSDCREYAAVNDFLIQSWLVASVQGTVPVAMEFQGDATDRTFANLGGLLSSNKCQYAFKIKKADGQWVTLPFQRMKGFGTCETSGSADFRQLF